MPRIDYHSEINVLVSVRGHPFDRQAFDAIFQAMDGITATMVDQPAAAQLMNPASMANYDALVLYDMPGLDFDGSPVPAFHDPSDALKEGFAALLEQGKPIVALHHAIAGWPGWPEYGEWLGGRFFYRPSMLCDKPVSDSGYRHEVEYHARVAAADHPVMQGIPADFAMKDELYLYEVFEDAVTPLLIADHDFIADNFFSAAQACDGHLHSNKNWQRAPGSRLVGWTKTAINSPLVYLQPGDDQTTYDNPNYRRLVENAIRWTISEAQRAPQ